MFPPGIHKISNFCTSSPILAIFCFIDNSHSNKCEPMCHDFLSSLLCPFSILVYFQYTFSIFQYTFSILVTFLCTLYHVKILEFFFFNSLMFTIKLNIHFKLLIYSFLNFYHDDFSYHTLISLIFEHYIKIIVLCTSFWLL